MRHIQFILASLVFISCTSKQNEQKHFINEEVITSKTEFKDSSLSFNNNICFEYIVSQEDNPLLFEYKIGNTKVAICGYRRKFDELITLGEILQDSSFYACGFTIYNYSTLEKTPLIEEGEYYLNKVIPNKNHLEIIRLKKMPSGVSLNYEWTQVISIKLFEENSKIISDTSFVLPVEKYNEDFLKYFKTEIEKIKNDPEQKHNYPEYLIDYTFIKAVKKPKEYSEKLKSLGTFDGYLGPIYRDILKYYEIFEK